MRDRIVAETRGNPLALLELPRGLTPAELAGGFGLPERRAAVRAGSRRASCAGSPRCRAETQRLLLVAAAEPVGDPALVWRAAERLGIAGAAAAPAVAAGLLEFGARVRFRHPLVRSAVYRAASAAERPARRTRRWPRRPIRDSIPIAGPGTAPRRPPGPTRTSPASWSGRPAGRRPAAGWPRRPRSWSARSR